MNFLIDTANLEDIRFCNEYFPVIGVTTNPTLIAREKVSDPVAHIVAIRKLIGPEKQLHVQLTETEYDRMLEEAEAVVGLAGKNTYLKVPVSPVGLKVTKTLSERGFGITETAILSVGQAVLAARAGARYVAPYVSRLDNINGKGVEVVSQIAAILQSFGMGTEILAASFKTVQQIVDVGLAGGENVTVNADLMRQLVSHPLTDSGIAGFAGDWKRQYGEQTLLRFLKK